jgi:Fe-S-cluster containining protein
VELSGRAEATGLEILGLEIEDDDTGGGLLMQPCRALEGKRCRIYAHRPACCRTFECRLLQDVRRGAVSVGQAGGHIADALSRIARVKELLAQVGQHEADLPLKERCADALALLAAANRDRSPGAAELEASMSAVEELIRERFLGRE